MDMHLGNEVDLRVSENIEDIKDMRDDNVVALRPVACRGPQTLLDKSVFYETLVRAESNIFHSLYQV